MKSNNIIYFTVCLFVLISSSFAQECLPEPVKIIFDSDIGPDYDDVGAMAVLHVLADSGYAEILATIASNKYEGVASVINIFNTYYNRPGIPIGVPKSNAVTLKDWQHWTDSILEKYPHKIKKNSEVPDAVDLYRKVLASQPDNSVTIVTVGFLTNLANLLETKGDKYSGYSGKELITKKVNKLVCMAGKFPSGREFNIYTDSLASQKVFTEWPAPILFNGFEIGEKIKTGLPITKNKNLKNSPVKDVFSLCIPMSAFDAEGRMSWDEIAVLIAIKGNSPWFSVNNGRIVIMNDGSNAWDSKAHGHSYIVPSLSFHNIEDTINNLIMCLPGKQ
jgi:pyrimidine-specific ribonucleoside hydrolase